MDEADWQPIDDLILSGKSILSIKAIWDANGCSLPEAVQTFNDRWSILRLTRPGEQDAEPEPR